MNVKAIGVFFIILIILAGFFLYEKYYNSSGTQPIVITKHNQTTNHTTNSTKPPPPTNTTKTNSTTNSTKLQNCVQNVPIANGNFSTGTYAGWNVTNFGFGSTPLNITYANSNSKNCYYGSPWSNYSGIFFATSYECGLERSVGNLTSNTFTATEPYLNFRIVSPASSLLYVQLLHNGKPFVTVHYDTLNASGGTNPESNFEKASIPLVSLICQNVSIRVFSGVVGTISTENQFIAAGDFQLSNKSVQTPGIVVNTTYS